MAAAEDKVEVSNVVPLPVRITKKLLGGGDDADVQRSNLIDLAEEMGQAFDTAGALEPPLDPLSLVRLVGMSATLRPLVDIMAANVFGFGYRFEPVIDLDAADAIARVEAAMLLEREYKAESEADDDEDPADVDEPTEDEVKERIDSLRTQQRRERARLEAFFANVNRKMSFTRIGRKMQGDKESTGYGVIEVRRDRKGRIARLTFGPAWTFRALSQTDAVEVDSRIRATDISYRTVTEQVRFRRFVQVYEGTTVYFREFGDPRVMSTETGAMYADAKAMEAEEPEAKPATELLWFQLDSSESDVYGQVRWSGAIPGVIGSREQAEVNMLFFRSKAIPPMVVMVSGGKLAKGARKRLEELIANEVKGGAENFWRIIVIEAEPSGRGIGGAQGLPSQDKVKIELRPLTEAIFKDALWQGYAVNNRHELGQAFRLPPMLRGDTDKLNRATARIAQQYVEQQVFGPERKDIEFDIDRTILADMGVMLWRFRLNAPETTDAEALNEFIKDLVDGVLTVNEARAQASRIFGVEYPPIDADWARMPVKFALGGMTPEEPPDEDDTDDDTDDAPDTDPDAPDDEEKAGNLIKLRLPGAEFDALIAQDDTPPIDGD
jgi:PBSX family phage portal protein